MKINGIDLSSFNSRLVSRTIESSETTINSVWTENGLTPFVDPNVIYRSKKIDLVIEFKGDFNVTEENKSRLLSTLSNCEITEFGRGTNKLTGYIVNHAVNLVNPLYQVVNYQLEMIETKDQVILNFSNQLGFSIDNSGTGMTPVKLDFTPTNTGDYVIKVNQGTIYEDTFTFRNCKAGVTRKISTEGIFENGINVQKSTDFYRFPRLITGNNFITVSPSTYSLKLTYSPRMV